MASPSVLSRIPVLRILVPFMLGILIHGLWHCWWVPMLLIAIASAFYIWLVIRSRTPQGRLQLRSYFIIPLATMALALGWLCAIIHCPPRLNLDQLEDKTLIGRVTDVEFTDFSMRLTIDILDKQLPPSKILLSTRGCDYTMKAGHLVAWRSHLEEVGAMKNPDEMDYASHLLRTKGIRYQQHLPINQVKAIGHSPTLITDMAEIRRQLALMVFNSELSNEAQQFVVALLLGNSRLIDKATRQEFAAAGVAHVLALSGLHVGFIALIIWWLLFPLDLIQLRNFRLFITLTAIALFAVFTGLSPSVMRATIMTGFVFASLVFHRRAVSLNALAMAALIILVFMPSSLYGVGFQLSFLTVAAILMFGRVPAGLKSNYKVINRLTSTVIVSLVAMLATIALNAHYFHTVSFLSVVTNLLILPVLPLFMVLGIVFLLVSAAGLNWSVLNYAIDTVYQYIHWAARSVNAIPFSHIGGVYVSTFGVVAYFVVMALIVTWLYRRNYRYLMITGCTLAILLGHSLWIDAITPREGLVVFNSFSSTPVFYYSGNKGYVWMPDDEDTDSTAFARYYSGFLARHNISDLIIIPNDTVLRAHGVLFKPPFAHLMGRHLLAVGSGKWKHMTSTRRLVLDDVIATKRFHSSVAKLQELYDFKRLIISGAMNSTTLNQLLHDCDSIGIIPHKLSQMGAVEEYESLLKEIR